MAAPTLSDERSFIRAIINECILKDAIEWIASHLNPEDVFPEHDLRCWAIDNGMEAGVNFHGQGGGTPSLNPQVCRPQGQLSGGES